MARKYVAEVLKTKDDNLRYKDDKGQPIKEFYIKIKQDITLKAGTYLNLENKAVKLASLEANKDKMSEEVYEKNLDRINKMADFVVFDIVQTTKD
jgi:hypothetical protein